MHVSEKKGSLLTKVLHISKDLWIYIEKLNNNNYYYEITKLNKYNAKYQKHNTSLNKKINKNCFILF